MKKTPSKAAHNRPRPFFFSTANRPKSQFLFHKNLYRVRQGETVVQDGNETDKIMRYVTPRNTLFIVQMAERGK